LKNSNCKEGKCIGINNITFISTEKKINFVKCDDSSEGTMNQKFFQEPAYLDTLFWARQWLNI